MKGLDTNVLLRYLTRDDPAQFATAQKVIEGAESAGDQLHLSLPVVCELVWTLGGGVLRFDRPTIAQLLLEILASPVFDLQARDRVYHAAIEYRAGKADFADYLIGQLDRDAGCSETVTFDRRLGKHDGFRLLPR